MYKARHKCVACSEYLSRGVRDYSDGICPDCGFDSCSTICDTKTEVGFWHTPNKFLFWKRVWVPKSEQE